MQLFHLLFELRLTDLRLSFEREDHIVVFVCNLSIIIAFHVIVGCEHPQLLDLLLHLCCAILSEDNFLPQDVNLNFQVVIFANRDLELQILVIQSMVETTDLNLLSVLLIGVLDLRLDQTLDFC